MALSTIRGGPSYEQSDSLRVRFGLKTDPDLRYNLADMPREDVLQMYKEACSNKGGASCASLFSGLKVVMLPCIATAIPFGVSVWRLRTARKTKKIIFKVLKEKSNNEDGPLGHVKGERRNAVIGFTSRAIVSMLFIGSLGVEKKLLEKIHAHSLNAMLPGVDNVVRHCWKFAHDFNEHSLVKDTREVGDFPAKIIMESLGFDPENACPCKSDPTVPVHVGIPQQIMRGTAASLVEETNMPEKIIEKGLDKVSERWRGRAVHEDGSRSKHSGTARMRSSTQHP